jgi:hypothetical protein
MRDSSGQVDTIIFATGYLYCFPFAPQTDAPFDRFPLTRAPPLSPPVLDKPPPESVIREPTVALGGVRVHHLDSYDIFFLPEPTLAFLGLPTAVVPFPLAEVQAHAVASVWSGDPPSHFKPTPRPGDSPELEDRLCHRYGFPCEFEIQNALLHDSGEGGKGKTDQEEDAEIDDSGRFLDVAEWRWKRREHNFDLRKAHLGY